MDEKKPIARNQCLKFQGKYYLPGTIVKLKQEFVDKQKRLELRKIYCFSPVDIGGYIYTKPKYVKYVKKFNGYNSYNNVKFYHFQTLGFPYTDISDFIFRDLKSDMRVFEGQPVPQLLQKQVMNWDILQYDTYMKQENFEDNIEEIIEGKEWTQEDNPLKSGSEVPGVIVGWVFYIILMLMFSIFNDRVGIWIVLTVIWICLRQHMILEASGYSDN